MRALVTVETLAKVYHLRAPREGQPEDARFDADGRFWALRDVSLAVHAGEALGLVGANGAGKTTLLRVLAGVTPPTRGVARVEGRLVGLLEAEAGFHHELTGAENLTLAAALRGFSRAELRAVRAAVVGLADVGAFLDVPVKRWSTGMRLKLAVALVLHLPADVLLLDEGLAVGDAAFRAAALERLAVLKAQGRALLIVSHEPELLAPVCDRVAWLEAGRVRELGPTPELLDLYAR